MKILLILTTFISFNSFATDWDDFIDSLNIEKEFVDPEYMGPWQEDTDVVMDGDLPLSQIKQKKFSCHSQIVWPAHPSQYTKDYLWARYSQYNHANLPPTSYACLTPNPTRRFCLRAAIAKAIVLSDTYVDECGNYYRGYWLVTYLRSDESMGTLYAKGRRGVQNPRSEYEYDFIDDTTYFVPVDQFLFFGELMSTDMKRIQEEKARALKGGMTLDGLMFVR